MYESVIGLEIHAQLLTRSKLFCACATTFGDPPNARTCPVCLGLPGALPVLNTAAVDLAITAALALECTVHAESAFARKNYFYPDLPKGYQITQFDRPLATGGRVRWSLGGRDLSVGIVRVHLEEDAGKSVHGEEAAGEARIDFNRSGVPLVEIVTAPDLGAPSEAAEFFRRLRALLVAVGVSDGNLEEGSLRCDANVSVRRAGDDALGTRVEIKNLNSFRFLERALDCEVARQTAILQAGGCIDAETRQWNERAGRTEGMRTKEEAEDYRYFPEPDLPPLRLAPERVVRLREALPEGPDAVATRLERRYGLDSASAARLAVDAALRRVFELAADESGDARQAAIWTTGELVRRLKETGGTVDVLPFDGRALGRLIRMIEAGVVSSGAAKTVLGRMVAGEGTPERIVEAGRLSQDSSEEELRALVDATLAAHPGPVSQFRGGKAAVLGFLIGQVMQASGGRANPGLVGRFVREWLSGSAGR